MEREKVVMSGNEAIARGAWEAGVRVASAYPGTPSTEILEALAGYDEITAQWSPNEKVAVEFAFGASLGGARTLASMKHVGVNVAMDPLMTIGYAGVNGGFVLISADDPNMFSSQNEQDNRNLAKFGRMALLEPASPQEAKEMMKAAFEMSERFDIPVMVRGTTRLCHGQGVVELGERTEVELRPYVKDYEKYMMLPSVCRKRRVDLEKRLADLEEYAETFAFNRIIEGSAKIGIITSSVASLHAREAMPDASFLILGMSNPLPRKLVRRFAGMVEKLYVIEELDPFLESQIKAMGVEVTGKEVITPFGELRPEVIKESLESGFAIPERKVEVAAPTRPPLFCPGCAHRPVFHFLRQLKATVTGDIGCYSLGAYPPLSSMDMNLCMGASIGVAHGMEKARRSAGKPRGRVAGIIGDSTFLHSGITPLLDMVYNKGSSCVILLDNDTTAMTGHQDHPGTGKDAKGRDAPSVDYTKLAQSLGLDDVVIVDPLRIDELKKTLKEALDSDRPSLVIARSPCALIARRKPTHFVEVDPDECNACGVCLKIGCPAIETDEQDRARVNPTLCVGCTVCTQLCKFKAMSLISHEEAASR
jgi:indolepyruvate ferredoxin oxidoreductase alpha subunit